jgi:four helix bundle protein
MLINSYQDLIVWQRAMVLAKDVYQLTWCFPKEEMFGLTSQVRRSSVSIAANIAEGWGRQSKGDYIHFLKVAQGSATELETEVILSSDIGFLPVENSEVLLKSLTEIRKMLLSLIRSLQASDQL